MFYHNLRSRMYVLRSFSWAMTSVPSLAWFLQTDSSLKASTLDTEVRLVAAVLEEKEDIRGLGGSPEEAAEVGDLSPVW